MHGGGGAPSPFPHEGNSSGAAAAEARAAQGLELCRLCESEVAAPLLDAHLRKCVQARGAGRPRCPGLADFELLKPISRGAFGTVVLARKRSTGDLFAVKAQRQPLLAACGMAEQLRFERDLMAHACHPFVVKLLFAFTHGDGAYLVMEHLPGGDLCSLLQAVGRLDEACVCGYGAEMVSALAYLHSVGVTHRDVKPARWGEGGEGGSLKAKNSSPFFFWKVNSRVCTLLCTALSLYGAPFLLLLSWASSPSHFRVGSVPLLTPAAQGL